MALLVGGPEGLGRPRTGLQQFRSAGGSAPPHLEARPFGLRAVHDETIRPDPLALQDDLKELLESWEQVRGQGGEVRQNLDPETVRKLRSLGYVH